MLQAAITVYAADKVNLHGTWSTFWSAIESAIGSGVLSLVALIGMFMVVGAVIKFVFDKKRGGGATQGSGAVLWTLIVGAILCAPGILLPIFLQILDFLANTVVAIFNTAL